MDAESGRTPNSLEQVCIAYTCFLPCCSSSSDKYFKEYNKRLAQRKAKGIETECLIPPRMPNKWEPIVKPRYQTINQEQLINKGTQLKKKKKNFRASDDLPCQHRLKSHQKQGMRSLGGIYTWLAKGWGPQQKQCTCKIKITQMRLFTQSSL